MTITRNGSIHSESSILWVSFVLSICLNNDYVSHIVDKDGDRNNAPLCGQFNDNVGTKAELEHVKLNLPKEKHSVETILASHNPKYERLLPYHILY